MSSDAEHINTSTPDSVETRLETFDQNFLDTMNGQSRPSYLAVGKMVISLASSRSFQYMQEHKPEVLSNVSKRDLFIVGLATTIGAALALAVAKKTLGKDWDNQTMAGIKQQVRKIRKGTITPEDAFQDGILYQNELARDSVGQAAEIMSPDPSTKNAVTNGFWFIRGALAAIPQRKQKT